MRPLRKLTRGCNACMVTAWASTVAIAFLAGFVVRLDNSGTEARPGSSMAPGSNTMKRWSSKATRSPAPVEAGAAVAPAVVPKPVKQEPVEPPAAAAPAVSTPAAPLASKPAAVPPASQRQAPATSSDGRAAPRDECHPADWQPTWQDAPYVWAHARPIDPVLAAERAKLPVPTEEQLKDTAIVTMAVGDSAARGATALMQSLRDVGTRIPNLVVMLFRSGYGSTWCDDYPRKEARGRGMNFPCSAQGLNGAVAEELAWPGELLAWERMGVQYQVMEAIPDTNWTHVAGGRATFWGMAFNKLRVFHMKQFKKIIWMDSDTLVFHNVDHLVLEPMMTAAYTQECMLENSGVKASGGLWVVEPSDAAFKRVEDMYSGPIPGSNPPKGWHFGDMQVLMYVFGKPNEDIRGDTGFPFGWDDSIGIVPGLRKYLPEFRPMTDTQWDEYLLHRASPRMKAVVKAGRPIEGTLPEVVAEAKRTGKHVWHLMDTRYDGLVGNCGLNGPLRDLGPDFFTVHFSCMPTGHHMHKPSGYVSERDLLDALRFQDPCVRYYTMRWYEIYRRAINSRLEPPYFEGEFSMTSAAGQ